MTSPIRFFSSRITNYAQRGALTPIMDPKHSGDVLKHLEKQKELLMEAYRSMSHELHKLQVEEEMLMRKYYEFMAARGLTDKEKDGSDLRGDGETSLPGAFVTVSMED